MAVTLADERRAEWPFLRAGLVAAAALAAVWLLGWGIYELVHEDPTRLELTTRCLTQEQFLPVTGVGNDPIAASASGGSLATRVEGNGVHLSIAGSDEEAEKIVRSYHAVAGPLTGRLERRGRYVYVWEGVASPTQRQAMFDCEY
jgi:hypothetical protein